MAGSFPVLRAASIQFIKSAARTAGPPEAIRAADLTRTGPGSLISAETMPEFAASSTGLDVQSARVVYRSTSGDDNAPTVVSGSVYVPLGPPPAGGWPVVAFAHGTTGIDEQCAPSRSGSLLGLGGLIGGIATNGFAVAVPDYEGLGEPGVHPYTDSRTAGLNLIDAVRALRATFKNVSSRWAALGHSQGGGAAWAADEWAKVYAPDLDLVGAVAVAPAANVVKLVEKAQAGTLTRDQMLAYALVIESLARRFPGLDRDGYRHGSALTSWPALTACAGPQLGARASAGAALSPQDLMPSSADLAMRLEERLKNWALPQNPLSSPLYVVYGSDDTLIDAQWTSDAIRSACVLGGVVVWEVQQGKGHGDVDFSRAVSWLVGRFKGTPATDDCAR